jgi:hypothetical protein
MRCDQPTWQRPARGKALDSERLDPSRKMKLHCPGTRELIRQHGATLA